VGAAIFLLLWGGYDSYENRNNPISSFSLALSELKSYEFS
jgi:hypothetical protein